MGEKFDLDRYEDSTSKTVAVALAQWDRRKKSASLGVVIANSGKVNGVIIQRRITKHVSRCLGDKVYTTNNWHHTVKLLTSNDNTL